MIQATFQKNGKIITHFDKYLILRKFFRGGHYATIFTLRFRWDFFAASLVLTLFDSQTYDCQLEQAMILQYFILCGF
jgi:hypothetical protein